ncbi:nucleotide pyrophosphohydrolase [Candidatus Dependentiae bacterium]|nr:nucleotide pyrophosphohydrolase [Candidatus Dependentiae bacterium]
MTDKITTVEDIKNKVRKFVEDREWQQFHSPKSLSMCIACEAAELMELFTWVDDKASKLELEKKREAVEHEAADVMFAILNFCLRNNIDVTTALETKIALLDKKYPIEKSKGNNAKYTEL